LETGFAIDSFIPDDAKPVILYKRRRTPFSKGVLVFAEGLKTTIIYEKDIYFPGYLIPQE